MTSGQVPHASQGPERDARRPGGPLPCNHQPLHHARCSIATQVGRYLAYEAAYTAGDLDPAFEAPPPPERPPRTSQPRHTRALCIMVRMPWCMPGADICHGACQVLTAFEAKHTTNSPASDEDLQWARRCIACLWHVYRMPTASLGAGGCLLGRAGLLPRVHPHHRHRHHLRQPQYKYDGWGPQVRRSMGIYRPDHIARDYGWRYAEAVRQEVAYVAQRSTA